MNLSKIRSDAGDKPSSGVNAENRLETIFKKSYKIRMDSQIFMDHGVFYPQALYNDLLFELTLPRLTRWSEGRHNQAEIQTEKHPARVRNDEKQDPGGRCEQHLLRREGVLVRPCSARRDRADRESDGHAGEPADQPPETVVERHPWMRPSFTRTTSSAF